ncbi:MAG: tyrosine recombinase [Lentihominibacter sp.]|jgi:integrase/recombinase XerD
MYTEAFAEHLQSEKKMAANSLEAYKRDVNAFLCFEKERGISDITEISSTEIVAYLHSLKDEGKSASTVNRKMASVRAFFTFLTQSGIIPDNPTINIRAPRIEKKVPEYFSIEEVEKLMECPGETIKGIRDKAILEILYATGIRASELIEIDLEDVNFRMGFITASAANSKARIIPLGRPAREALEEYVFNFRDKLLKEGSEEKALFVNYAGARISRQGLWKTLKEYGEKAGLNCVLTPNTLRNSFAVHMLQNGADLKSLQELMGHEDITATQMYLAATKSRIKDVYDHSHPRAK